jgi:general secretion pathway protein C
MKSMARKDLWLPYAIAACAGFWLLLSLSKAVWWIADKPQASTSSTSVDANPAAAIIPLNVPQLPLASYRLFGGPGAAVAQASAAINAPETQLKLSLRGTLEGRTPEAGLALIAEEGGVEKQYRVGESVSNAQLRAVFKDHVVLAFQGRMETLSLPRQNNMLSGAGNQPTTMSIANNPSAPISDPSNGFVAPAAGIGAAGWEAVRQAAIGDPLQLASQVTIVPGANGGIGGVQINATADAQILQRAGLQAGDIIVAVNGQRINSMDQGMAIVQQMQTADQVSVTVKRGDREFTLPSIQFR